MSRGSPREILERFSAARREYLDARLGEHGLSLALLDENEEARRVAYLKLMFKGDEDGLRRHTEQAEFDKRIVNSPLKQAEQMFTIRTNTLFRPIYQRYFIEDVGSNAFALYEPVMLSDPDDPPIVGAEVIGCVIRDNEVTRAKITGRRTEGKIVDAKLQPFSEADARVLELGLDQLDEIAVVLSME